MENNGMKLWFSEFDVNELCMPLHLQNLHVQSSLKLANAKSVINIPKKEVY